MTAPLPIRRVAITEPPADWFHGIDRAIVHLYRRALHQLGVSTFDVPVDAFLPPDMARISAVISGLRDFRPDLAIGLSNGAYALLCRLPPQRDGWRPNLFLDALDLPTILLWDASLGFADQVLRPLPPTPAESRAGAAATLSRVLSHPRAIHWSRDTGQTAILTRLGFVRPDRVIHDLSPALPGFSLPDDPAAAPGRNAGIGFIGHVYQAAPAYPDPGLDSLANVVVQTWLHSPSQPFWEVLSHQVAALHPETRRRLSLDTDETCFWAFAHPLTIFQAQTALRLNLLGSSRLPIACYGDLRPDLSGVPPNLVAVPSDIPFGPELAAAFRKHSITIDISNPGFVHGRGHKAMLGFASGGFLLVERKKDFVDAFGEAGEAVSFRNADELAAKADDFLRRPRLRCELARDIRESIRGRFQAADVLRRVLTVAAGWLGPPASPAPPAPFTDVLDLLPAIRSEPWWEGASAQPSPDGLVIVTPRQCWTYAAIIPIPEIAGTLRDPCVRIDLAVEVGRIGLAVLLDTGALTEEQVVGRVDDAITVIVEVPRSGASAVMFRNTAECVTRAAVIRATLCDRRAEANLT